jgi:hypothetical protein
VDDHRAYPKLSKWVCSCVLAILIGAVTIFYCLFHLGFHVPLKVLWTPFLAISLLTLLLAPGLWWSWKEQTVRDDKFARLYLISGCYTLLSLLIYVYYASHLRFFSGAIAEAVYAAVLVGVPAVFVGAFFLRRAVLYR